MKTLRRLGRTAFVALLCASLLAWSVRPAQTHAPSPVEMAQNLAPTDADHGHSHGVAEDLYQAVHGHSHDVADHDHAMAVLARGLASAAMPDARADWGAIGSRGDPGPVFRLRRPPRG